MVNNSVLLIGYYFAPHRIVGAKRFSYFSNTLLQSTNQVHVLTIKEKYFNEKDISLPFGGVIHRTNIFPFYPLNPDKKINRIINRFIIKVLPVDQFAGWIIPALTKGISILRKNRIDKIVVTGPPFSSFLVGYFLSIIFKKELVIDYQDPWFLYKRKESKFGARINFKLEKKIIGKAKTVIFNTQRAMDEYISRLPELEKQKKSVVIPNPFLEINEVKPLRLEQNKKVILYTGNFYGKRKLDYLIEPLKRILCEGAIPKNEISIHVFGSILNEDLEEFERNELSEIIVQHDKVDFNELLRYLKGADILFLSQGEDHKYSVAYKLTDYLSIRKPILAITSKDSAIYEAMKNMDCGIAADIDDPEEIYTSLKQLLTGNKKYSFNGVEKYSLPYVMKQLTQIIN